MPRRTKACAICRKKRIKCDATMPHCQMCIKFGRQCPGPTDAPLLFIDNSSYPSGKRPKKPKGPFVTGQESQPALSRSRHLPSPDLSSPDAGENATEEEIVRAIPFDQLPYELAFDLTVHVSPRYVLNEAFYSNLVRFFCAEGRSLPGAPRRTPIWLHALPKLASGRGGIITPPKQNSSQEALSLALRATTSAFSGIETRNASLVEYSSRLYGAALRGQGKLLAAEEEGGSRVRDRTSEMEMLGTSVLLSMFEAIVATTKSAYAEHVLGSANLVARFLKKMPKPTGVVFDQPTPPPGAAGAQEKRPPITNKQPLLTGIFFHLRFQLTFVYLTSSSERLRQDSIIMTMLEDACGWDVDNLPLMQRQLRPIARLSTLLHNTNLSAWQRRWAYKGVKDEVDQLWAEYEGVEKTQKLRWTNVETGQTDFRDPFTALTYAYFAACWALLDVASPPEGSDDQTTVLPMRTQSRPSSQTGHGKLAQSPESSSPPGKPSRPLVLSPPASQTASSSSSSSSSSLSISEQHGLILSVAWYLRLRDVGFSYLRLHTPLFVTAMYAPSVEQRRVARIMFEEWKSGALRGIGEMGVGRLDEEVG
ncbi:hypothetical protein DM02DRAFT_100124 [Periconia macrospinosa]|uniref:Zn(2)-C6 fungal-type domain-containing protein n=1 Tax=Periconia macrospinosa TaxID=97972 RepID=A0A2V1E4J3_9PLEO|nr:hypothetical protein DM02DRAFT_100124 [Periconia macrospinosa]